MTRKEVIAMEDSLSERTGGLRLLAVQDAITVLLAMKQAKMRCPAFEGFIIHPNGGVQPEQDYSKNYTDLAFDDAYEMSLKYFESGEHQNIKYDFAYDRSLANDQVE